MILGGSKIGRGIAEELQAELSVRLIEQKREKAEWLASNLKQTMVLHGDGTDVELLKAENINEADSFISVTETNKRICYLVCLLIIWELSKLSFI